MYYGRADGRKTAPARVTWVRIDNHTSGYSALQKKAVAIVSEAQKITQYFDRDTRSDFAGANGAQSLLQKFLANPTQDLAAYQKSIQDFWDQLPPLV